MPPIVAPGWSTQYRTLGRWPTSSVRSAWKTMFMLPATSIWPAIGRPRSATTWLRPPSAAIT